MHRSAQGDLQMLEIIRFFIEKIDFLHIAQIARQRKDRLTAARLHLILVQSYEIIELYRVILDELESALKAHRKTESGYRFHLNEHRISALLLRQSSNLEVMETLTDDLFFELRTLDNNFLKAYRQLFPGKGAILNAASALLANARLPLAETGPGTFPMTGRGDYRTLWLTRDGAKHDRREIEKYLYGHNGKDKQVIDVALSDGDAFFEVLTDYLENQKPREKLASIEALTDNYRLVLEQNFTASELLSDIGKVAKHYSHRP